MVLLLTAVLLGATIWSCVLALPWRAWSTAERLEARSKLVSAGQCLDDVTVLIPARDEAGVIATTLAALSVQSPTLSVVLIDDESTDETVRIAQGSSLEQLVVVRGRPLPAGWRGKVWALEQGRPHITTPYVALVDADVELAPNMLATMIEFMRERNLGLCSVMVELAMHRFWATLLNPAFIFFFKLLYPFHLANTPGHWMAASAGGLVVLRSDILASLGGFGVIRDALIDDCALARAIKRSGHSTWIGLTRSASSRRPNDNFASLWATVTRSAYTQLQCSPVWLVTCTLLMLGAFVAPVVGLVFGDAVIRSLGGATILAMVIAYRPVLKFYDCRWWWAWLLPFTGSLFLAMTWHSAIQHWAGSGASWKRRAYQR